MSELSQAIEEMRTMRENYDSLAAASSAYNEGRAELAANLRAKGIEASESESLPALAEKVTQIQTQEITIDGGEMYEKQIYGKSLHNLIEISAHMIEVYGDTYKGILVCEFYKGYDSLDLTCYSGAYVACLTSDGDFYSEDTTPIGIHYWHDENDGYMDRYVVFMWISENFAFGSVGNGTCPRKISVVGNCTNMSIQYSRLVSVLTQFGRYSNLNIAGNGSPGVYYDNIQIIRNYEEHSGGYYFFNADNLLFIDAEIDTISGGRFFFPKANALEGARIAVKHMTGGFVFCAEGSNVMSGLRGVLEFPELEDMSGGALLGISNTGYSGRYPNITGMRLPKLHTYTGGNLVSAQAANLTRLELPVIELMTVVLSSRDAIEGIEQGGSGFANLEYAYIGYSTNDRTKSILFEPNARANVTTLTDIELKDGFCKPLRFVNCNNLTAENIALHILDRLGDNTDGATLTITIGSTNLNRINADETYAPYVAAAVAKNYIIN